MLRAIGNGSYDRDVVDLGGFGDEYICLPEDIVLDGATTHALSDLIEFVYPALPSVPINALPGYLAQRAILAPKNDIVGAVNNIVLSQLPVAAAANHCVYSSADSVEALDDEVQAAAANDNVDAVQDEATLKYPVEFLNTVNLAGFPPHRLELKVNATVMLLRNLCPRRGLCNGTRLMLKRLQFPVCLAFAMTIDKSQGQTVPRIGIFLPEPVFAHGQLYVAMSRVQARADIKILALNSKSANGRTYTKNIVYDEVLDDTDRQLIVNDAAPQ
ncbi:hypothetical protein SPRG_21836 [Saprolegnia parasitica CBS 223.65]|uniref:DNA helicase Pif1-like 2B domain-containing protein n=1 Tax=Saprolegnia parasitica (strain CBS 223.65) TaxID=695850 RepID=A0A067BHP0_SAPPC|nr:hypothetical protein SPRG_21836 [Saprolegnia parasitica CBS 223.65]KDO17668.1 hypothetical protein SPRG_21836 [Saprolegnia parasitica CBS 223.65]|eukprot:XP_012211621.1 hypothetical protein SPRG_21836 [Saprolegnia parasitica CBS 223.65]